MHIEFRKDASRQYMIVDTGEKEADDFRIRMLTENNIPGFLKCFDEQMNGNILLYYDITGKQKVSDYLKERHAGEEFYKIIFNCIARAIENVREYLLDEDGIMLNPEYMFRDPKNEHIDLVYYPYYAKDFMESCKELSESLLQDIDYDARRAIDLGYGFYKNCVRGNITSELLRDMSNERYTNDVQDSDKILSDRDNFFAKKEENFGKQRSEYRDNEDDDSRYAFLFGDIKKDEKKKKGSSWINKLFRVKEKNREYKVENEPVKSDEKTENRTYKKKNEIPAEAEYRENDLATVFLKQPDVNEKIRALLMLENKINDDGIMLSRDKYIVGKKVAGAEIVLSSVAVSRVHAKLIWQETAYYIIDLGSKNGTKINGRKLPEGKRTVLKDGDKIEFADMKCIYKQPRYSAMSKL